LLALPSCYCAMARDVAQFYMPWLGRGTNSEWTAQLSTFHFHCNFPFNLNWRIAVCHRISY
jgi:hypothetical protein